MSPSGRGRSGFCPPGAWGLSGLRHNWLRWRSPFLFPILEKQFPSSLREVELFAQVVCLGIHLICKYCCSRLLTFCSDRLVPELDTVVPIESTKAYDMLDIIHSVSLLVWAFLRLIRIYYVLCVNNWKKQIELHWRYFFFFLVFTSYYFYLCSSHEQRDNKNCRRKDFSGWKES